MRKTQLREIFEKTNGHCHFCGDPISFEKRGGKHVENPKGYWEADHVVQSAKGGASSIDNYLPACVQCNKLRWDRKGEDLRELLILGLIAKDEIKAKSDIGHSLLALQANRRERNIYRRKSTR